MVQNRVVAGASYYAHLRADPAWLEERNATARRNAYLTISITSESVSERHSVASQPNSSALATMFFFCGLKANSLPLVTRTTSV
jgi:hypothetical protein